MINYGTNFLKVQYISFQEEMWSSFIGTISVIFTCKTLLAYNAIRISVLAVHHADGMTLTLCSYKHCSSSYQR